MVRGTNLGVQLGRSRGNDGRLGVMLGRKQLLYAITSFSVANYYATQNPGGEAGVATGFLSLVVARADKILGAVQVLTQRNGAAAGHQIYVDSGGGINAQVYDGAANKVASSTLTASDVGKLHAFLLYHDSAKLWLWVDRQQIGSGTAVAGYTPSPTAQRIGLDPNAVFPAITFPIAAALSARGTPSDVQIRALFDDVRVRGDVPTSFAGATVTHRWSARDALAGGSVVDGQTAPASLPDTVTGAAADAMTRTGSPTVRVLDTSIDGRRTYGALGFGATAHFTTATPGGVRGSVNGFSFVHHAILWSLTGNEVLFHCANSAGTQGWYLVREAATLRWYSSNGVGGIASSPTRTLVSGDLGRPLMIYGVRDAAGMLYLYLDGVSVGAATGPVASYALASWSTMIGVNQALANPAVSMSWFGSGGGSGATFIFDAAEVAAHYAASVALGQIAQHAKLEHVWFPNTDILAAGGPSAGIPAQVRDRVGTDHLTRVGGLSVDDGALRGFSARDFVASTPAGGLKGAASGHWVEILVNKRAFATDQMVYGSGSGSSANGVQINIYNGALYVAWGSGSGSVTATPQYALTDGSHHICVVHNGTSGVVYVDGVQRETTTPFTPVAAPATSPNTIGVQRSDTGAFPATVETIYGVAGGDSVPSAGEVEAASVYALANKKVGGIPGKTDRRYSLVDDIAEAGGKIPAVWRERVAGVDHMITIGSGLQVAQRVERIYSWEAA